MIGIDVGITNTEVVIVSKGRMGNSIGAASKKGVVRKLLSLVSKDEVIAITGAGAKNESALLKEREIIHVDEIGAIGIGASSLTEIERCVVASIGTGTAIVYVDKKKCFHLGGTGIGGGTLVGLGRKLLRLEEAERIADLAEMGNLGAVNITVGDVYGHGIGIVPADATAANFAKRGKAKKEDVARGIISLVGETAGVLACFAAREKGVENIVFVGRVPTMPVMQDVLERTASMFGFKAVFPDEARFSTAFGAALIAEKR